MRKRVWLVALTAGLSGLTLAGAHHVAGAAPTVRQVAFRGSYSGRLDMLVRPTGFQLVAYGRGRATLLGESVLLGSGPTEQPRPGCWTFEGLASLIGSNGDRIYLEFGKSTGCATTRGGSAFHTSQQVNVLGGTGALARAKGRLTLTSSGNSLTGAITFTYSGALSY